MFCRFCASFATCREVEVGLHWACAANARYWFIDIKKNTAISGERYDYVFALEGRREAQPLFDVL
jgi:hypothetical protein